jgi:hypothetical protein
MDEIKINFTDNLRILLTEKRDLIVSYIEYYKNELTIFENNLERIILMPNSPIYDAVLVINNIKSKIQMLEKTLNKYNNVLIDTNSVVDIEYFIYNYNTNDKEAINFAKIKCNIV